MFKAPEMDVVRFNVEDVITTSQQGGFIPGDSTQGGGTEEEE